MTDSTKVSSVASEVAGAGSLPPLAWSPPGASVATETIHVLMGRILAELPAVGKGSKAPAGMGGYSFRGIDDTLNALNPILSRHGVFFMPFVEKRRDSDRETGKGGTLWMVSLRVRYRFYGPLGDWVDCVVEGEGSDSGDKATQKAMTAAMKYMLFQVFAISTQEVGEMDAERHEVPETSPRRQEPRKPPQSADNLSAQFIASARKLGVVIEPGYIAGKSTDELNDLWAEIKAGKHTGDVLGSKGPQDAPGAPSGLSPLAALPDDLAVIVKEKHGRMAAGWVAEFMQRKGRMVPNYDDLAEIEKECR
jgi:ERF superfamily